jgi:hypothetical protein
MIAISEWHIVPSEIKAMTATILLLDGINIARYYLSHDQ